jgi:hypothetical protein
MDEEGRMVAGRGAANRWGLILVALMLAACATTERGGGTRTREPITDLKGVVGRWDGLLSGLSTRPAVDQDFVEVLIRGDGTYEAKAFRTVGVFQGRGTVEAKDGSLVIRGERGTTGVGQLFSVDGRRELQIDTTSADGRHVSARLSPKP